jgi:hypothetical protein
VLVECIKNDLFPKAKYVLGKDEWDVGGMIYKDYIKCCRGRIGLQTMMHYASWEDSRYSKGERTMKVKVKSCC